MGLSSAGWMQLGDEQKAQHKKKKKPAAAAKPRAKKEPAAGAAAAAAKPKPRAKRAAKPKAVAAGGAKKATPAKVCACVRVWQDARGGDCRGSCASAKVHTVCLWLPRTHLALGPGAALAADPAAAPPAH